MSVNLSEINDKNIFYVGDVPLGHFAVCLQWLLLISFNCYFLFIFNLAIAMETKKESSREENKICEFWCIRFRQQHLLVSMWLVSYAAYSQHRASLKSLSNMAAVEWVRERHRPGTTHKHTHTQTPNGRAWPKNSTSLSFSTHAQSIAFLLYIDCSVFTFHFFPPLAFKQH